MPLPYTRPGVYAQVVSTPQLNPNGVPGSVALLWGTAPKGSSLPGGPYQSFSAFIHDYGDPSTNPGYSLLDAAQYFFAQAAPGLPNTPALVPVRCGATLASVNINTGQLVLAANPNYAGSAGNLITLAAAASVWVAGQSAYLQTITVADGQGLGYQESYSVYDPTNAGATAMSTLAALLNQKSQVVSVSSYTNGTFLSTATYQLSGGTDGRGAAIVQSDIDKAQAVDVDFVGVLQGDLATQQMVLAHVQYMASKQKPRIGFAGANTGTSFSGLQTFQAGLVDAAGHMVVAGHDSIKVVNPTTQLIEVVPGYMLSAVFMGIKSGNRVEMPLTGRKLQSVIDVGSLLSTSQVDTLASVGCSVIERTTDGVFVVDGLTTADRSTVYAFVSIRHCEDRLVKKMLRRFRRTLFGQPGVPATQSLIQAECNSELLEDAGQFLINKAYPCVATQRPNQVGVWDLNFAYVPTGETRVIYVNITVLLA